MSDKYVLELLIKSYDAYIEIDKVIIDLSGNSIAEGKYKDLTYLSDIILKLSHPSWSANNYQTEMLWSEVISNTDYTALERAGILTNGVEEYINVNRE